MEKHLKTQQEYEDRFDEFTVRSFREIEKIFLDRCQKNKKLMPNGKEWPPELYETLTKMIFDVSVPFRTVERYKTKKETIDEWTNQDKRKDELFEQTKAPIVKCKICFREMKAESKYLWGREDDRVMFMFVCPNKCVLNRAIFENGEEWEPEPDLCPKCKKVVETVYSRNGDVIATTYTCNSCGHKYTDKLDVSIKTKLEDPDFEKDKERFCMSDEKVQGHITGIINLEIAVDSIMEMARKEEDKEFYDKAKELIKLTIPQLKERLINLLKDEVYRNLVFDKLEMGLVVSLGFSIEDPTDQQEYDSRQKLTKILKNNLEETNWRLMTDGINYRLGVLTGRLRVYEKEEDMAQLIKSINNKNDKKG